MKALITGSSCGLGKEIAIYLDELGYETILVARDIYNLNEVKNQLKNKCKVINKDLSKVEEVYSLYEEIKNEDIDIVVNNAGIGEYGYFLDIDVNKEISMINLNITSVHILTKLFLQKMTKVNKGRILNISSLSGFSYGPLMASYYATKSYVTSLTCSIYKELKVKKSKVKISCCCPGPIETNFNNSLDIKFSNKPLKASFVAKYTIDKCLKNKLIIIPGIKNKIAKICVKFLPIKWILSINYNIQMKKVK